MRDKDKEEFENKLYFCKYKPETKIGEGSFGKIFSGKQTHFYNSYKHYKQ